MSNKLIKKNKLALTEEMSNIIRPELNLEKWPGIFLPAQSRTKPRLKVLERNQISEDGSFSKARVEVNPSLKYGNMNTEDQKVLYGLISIWERTGRFQGFWFSLRELAKELVTPWGGTQWKNLIRSLMRLNISTITWYNSYYNNTTKQTLEVLNSFQIIATLKLAKTKKNKKSKSADDERCYCKFSDDFYQNLISNYTKPTYLNVVLGFKSGVAQLLYKYFELVMHNKTNYERNSKELFQDINLEGEEYRKPSIRKRVFETAIVELNNKPIPSGILQVKLEQTKDESDWKIIVKKMSHITIEQNDSTTEKGITPVKTKQTSQPRTKLEEKIVLYFLEKFNLPRKKALRNEFLIAKEWIEVYNLDLEKGQALVNYAKVWATETNFAIQNFAGLGQYLDRGLEKIAEIDLGRQIERCKLCDSYGKVDCEDSTRVYSKICPHRSKELQEWANFNGVRIRLNDGSFIEPKKSVN